MAGDDVRAYARREHDHSETYETAPVLPNPVTIGSTEIHSGTGTPESAVTAPIGSLFMRDDGGAATSLYVKESGTGNTGWVAK